MEKEQLKRIFEFLEDKEELNAPLIWKHINNIPLTEEDLIVDGDLMLRDTKITSLPEGLEVVGNLNLSGCRDITSLPEGLKVEGDLYIEYSYVELPKGLEVGGDVYATGTYLENYTKEQVMTMISPGFIKGKIYRQ